MADTRYRKKAGAVFTLKYHLVFCPKYRRAILGGELKQRLEQLLSAKAEELGATIHAMEIMPDHVHLFVESDPPLAPLTLPHNSKAPRRVACGKNSRG